MSDREIPSAPGATEPEGYWREEIRRALPAFFDYVKKILDENGLPQPLIRLHKKLRPKPPKGMKSVSSKVLHHWEFLYHEINAIGNDPDLLQLLEGVLNHELERDVYIEAVRKLSGYYTTFTLLCMGDQTLRTHFLLIGVDTYHAATGRKRRPDPRFDVELIRLQPSIYRLILAIDKSKFAKMERLFGVYKEMLDGPHGKGRAWGSTRNPLVREIISQSGYRPQDRYLERNVPLPTSADVGLFEMYLTFAPNVNRVLEKIVSLLTLTNVALFEMYLTFGPTGEGAVRKSMATLLGEMQGLHGSIVDYTLHEVRNSNLTPEEISGLFRIFVRGGWLPAYYAVEAYDFTGDELLERLEQALEHTNSTAVTTIFERAKKESHVLKNRMIQLVERKGYTYDNAVANEEWSVVRILFDERWTWMHRLSDQDLGFLLSPHVAHRRCRDASFLREEIYKSGVDPNELLDVAIEYEMPGLLVLLFRDSGNPRLTLTPEMYPWVVAMDNVGVVRAFIDAGMRDATSNDSEALVVAAANGNMEIVKLLLDSAVVNVSAQGNAAFYEAMSHGHHRLAIYLMQNAHIDHNDREGGPLIAAAASGELSSVNYLLSFQDTDVTARDYAALREAATREDPSIFLAILEYVDEEELRGRLLKDIEDVASPEVVCVLYEGAEA